MYLGMYLKFGSVCKRVCAYVNVFTILSRMKFKKDWHERNCKKKRQNDVGQITDFNYCTKRVGKGFKHDSRIKSCLVWRVCFFWFGSKYVVYSFSFHLCFKHWFIQIFTCCKSYTGIVLHMNKFNTYICELQTLHPCLTD